MSAPDLTITRLSASTPAHGPRVARLLRGVAEHRLDRALETAMLPPGIWCVRRLDVPVRLDLARPDGALDTAWADALVAALRRALAGGCPDVVRYHRDVDAVTDLICGAATGRTERAWAWRRIGLLGPADPEPARDPAAAILAVLCRHPQHAVAAITGAAGRVGLPPLHRVLGSPGWAAVAGIAVAATASPTASLAEEPRAAVVEASPADRALATALAATSSLVEAIRSSRLRPDPETVAAWARLIVTEVDASVLRRSTGRSVVAAVAGLLSEWIRPVLSGLPKNADVQSGPVEGSEAALRGTDDLPFPDAQGPQQLPAPISTGIPIGRAPADGEGIAGVEERRAGRPTAWGGLLFLLATAADVGVPEAVLDDPAFATRPLPWVLQGIAVSLGLPSGDPAVAAFAGVDPDERQPWQTGRPATELETGRLDAIAGRWTSATAAALADTERDPVEVVTAVIRRRGHIDYVPGWIEVELELDEVDVGVRRAGLDLDPGWVPWLGVVVRFRYV